MTTREGGVRHIPACAIKLHPIFPSQWKDLYHGQLEIQNDEQIERGDIERWRSGLMDTHAFSSRLLESLGWG